MVGCGKASTIFFAGFLFFGVPTRGLHSENARPEGAKNPTVADFDWLAGRWIGKPVRLEAGKKDRNLPKDPEAEQFWSAPDAGLMIGMFRLVDGSETLVLEFMSLRDTSAGVEMMVRHFSPALQNWEEDPILLRLHSYDGHEAVFHNPIHARPKRSFLKRTGNDAFVSRSEILGENGQTAIIELPMQRASQSVSRNPIDAPSKSARNAVMESLRFLYDDAKRNAIRSAEIVPEEQYEHKPAQGARSFREIVGHMIDAQNLFCTAAAGETAPDNTLSMEESGRTKAQVLESAAESFEYCDKVYAAATDDDLGNKIFLGKSEEFKALPLILNLYHLSRHYGNIVAYMRLMGIVPPSSQR